MTVIRKCTQINAKFDESKFQLLRVFAFICGLQEGELVKVLEIDKQGRNRLSM